MLELRLALGLGLELELALGHRLVLELIPRLRPSCNPCLGIPMPSILIARFHS